ncbi:MAG: HAMP domain-containing histidine kinase [Ruminococcaceae bacterium]|nr:HAMP domain-containing histidine kinase [Oscillospiraceae bacterium]
MKRTASIKTRITIWYTTLMLVLMAVVLSLVGGISYRLSIDNIEKDVVVQVSGVNEKLSKRDRGVFFKIENNEEFKNVTVYTDRGEYVAGKYNYDIDRIPFKEGNPRRESVDGKEYIIYDLRTATPPGIPPFWIRGAESVNSSVILGQSMFYVVLILVPIILLLTALGGYYITKKAFMPISDITKTADDIRVKGDVKKRIPLNPEGKEDELFRLSVTLNAMLDNIENLITKEKQFTSDASHELRTPISVVLSQGEYLLEIAETEKERELAQNIVDKANQMSKLVSSLLLLSRIDQNRQKLIKKDVELRVLVDVAVETTKAFAGEKRINVNVKVEENLTVYVDETLMLSVITNLINNAVKYGKESGNVNITAKKEGSAVNIIVKDDGIGISKENLEKIWDRFYRVDDVRNDEYGSNGLGLSMVKSIVELHGGKISVESEIGKGTEFKIVI